MNGVWQINIEREGKMQTHTDFELCVCVYNTAGVGYLFVDSADR